MLLVYICLTAILALCIHYLVMGPYGYWKKRDVPYAKPVPLFGNLAAMILMKKMFGEIFHEIYKKFEGYRYVGTYKMRQPALLVRDPELIKEVLVKNFSSFHDNDVNVTEERDPIMGKNPFFLQGHKWKDVRSQITGAITTGKIKSIFNLIVSVTKDLVEYLNTTPEASNGEGLEARELASKFTTDVVALCAFGLDAKSFKDPNADFRRMGRKFLSPSTWLSMKQAIIFVFPSVANFLKLKIMPSDVAEWFISVVTATIKYREENNIIRNDYLDLMISLKEKPGKYVFTDMDVVAQAMTFYVDGFETSSLALSFTLYELAENLDVQQKLREEVDSVLAKHKGELTYEAIQDMTYLEKVFYEGLRKYPAGTVLTKKCTMPTTFPPAKEGGKPLEIEKGLNVIIPVMGLHYDPQYFPDPEKFDPERHSEEAKAARPKCTFLPFGEGPRQCLGFRFALVQTRAAIAAIIKDFEITPNPKTKKPLVWDPTYFMPCAKGGLWLNFNKRKYKA